MKRRTVLLISILALLMAGVSWAAVSGELHIPWWTVSSGGGTLRNDPYVLTGTVGQTEAGEFLNGGDYRLSGGFWPGGEASQPCFGIFLPFVAGPDSR
jgi:hypothetical protein